MGCIYVGEVERGDLIDAESMWSCWRARCSARACVQYSYVACVLRGGGRGYTSRWLLCSIVCCPGDCEHFSSRSGMVLSRLESLHV
jgi:hypothetical protein